MNTSIDSLFTKEQRIKEFIMMILEQVSNPDSYASAPQLYEQAVKAVVRFLIEAGYERDDLDFNTVRDILIRELRKVFYSESFINERDHQRNNGNSNGNGAAHLNAVGATLETPEVLQRRISNLLITLEEYKTDLIGRDSKIQAMEAEFQNHSQIVEQHQSANKKLKDRIQKLEDQIEDLEAQIVDLLKKINDPANVLFSNEELDKRAQIILAQIKDLESTFDFVPALNAEVGEFDESETSETIEPVDLAPDIKAFDEQASSDPFAQFSESEIVIPRIHKVYYERFSEKQNIFPSNGKLRVDVFGVGELFRNYMLDQKSRYREGMAKLYAEKKYNLIELYFILQDVPESMIIIQLLEFEALSFYQKTEIQELMEYLIPGGLFLKNEQWVEVTPRYPSET